MDEKLKILIIQNAKKIGYKHTGKKVNRDKILNLIKENKEIEKSLKFY